tara:strand:- start:231 stop:551 length:321 start_codon:yes stop_codon:yes gene_type:complete
MLVKGKELESRIKKLLSEKIAYQKSDLALVSRIWFDDLKKIKSNNINSTGSIEFLQLFRDGHLTNHESITRCRRKLQAEYPELRDESVYKGRAKVKLQMESERTYW